MHSWIWLIRKEKKEEKLKNLLMREKTAEEEQTAKYKESEGPLSPDESNSESLHLYDDEDYLKLK